MPHFTTVILFGATNQKFGGNTTLSLLAEKFVWTCIVISISGVGVPQDGDGRCTKFVNYVLVLITGEEEEYYEDLDISQQFFLSSLIDP
jgi:hypothetical protein